jgi:hypothetical protein
MPLKQLLCRGSNNLNFDARLIAKRMWKREYIRFIEEEIEPANNAAELTIRQTALDRIVTQESVGL